MKETHKMKNNSNNNVAVASLSEVQLVNLLRELQAYLKTKLKPCKDEQGIIDYWSCGVDHFNPPRRYEPFNNFERFCTKRKIDRMEFINWLELYSNMVINCECYIVNDRGLK
jgi:hypothetical protein